MHAKRKSLQRYLLYIQRLLTTISPTTATSGGFITSDGGATIISNGVCWSTAANPSTADSKSCRCSWYSQFVSSLSGLTAGTTYHVRAYATNSVGTAFGVDRSFSTSGQAPESLTQPATNITTTGATLNATVNPHYLSTTVTFEYGTTTGYGSTVTATQSPVTGNNMTNINIDISGLTSGTTYHFRVKTENSLGITYGNDLTFEISPGLPVLTTTPVSGITTTFAQSGGTITSGVGATIIARGVCWSINTNPTIADNFTSDGSGTGAFSSNITGLTSNTTYYLRAYAIISVGIAFGEEVSFTTAQITAPTLSTTPVTSITLTTAVSGGNISNPGGSMITARGVCWTTNTSPTISNEKTTDGTGSGIFTSNLTGLLPGITYYVRSYATNIAGTAYGDEVSFTTSSIMVPSLTTTPVTSVTLTTATSGGNISADGGEDITSRGVCWATSSNPSINDSKTTDGAGTGSFESILSALQQGTTYYLRAYATNSVGTGYGNEVTFNTNPGFVPTFRIAEVLSINVTTALFNCFISSDFAGNITASGVCWATTPNPTLINTSTSDWKGNMIYQSNLTGLQSSTIYYARAYATNSEGTGYSEQIQFTTLNDHTGETGTINDIDGNTYSTIGIGSQIWMAENLKTTKYNDGTDIPLVTDSTEWMALLTPAYCWYNNDASAYKDPYGALYNWFTLDAASNGGKNACPIGWHLFWNDWGILFDYLGGYDGFAGGKLKESGTTHWNTPNTGATNETGFTALPGGDRYNGFGGIGTDGNYWSSLHGPAGDFPSANGYTVMNNEANIHFYNRYDAKAGFSVRCVKDN